MAEKVPPKCDVNECPVCEKRTIVDGGLWYCAPCKSGGDVLKWYMQKYGMSFPDALVMLGEVQAARKAPASIGEQRDALETALVRLVLHDVAESDRESLPPCRELEDAISVLSDVVGYHGGMFSPGMVARYWSRLHW